MEGNLPVNLSPHLEYPGEERPILIGFEGRNVFRRYLRHTVLNLAVTALLSQLRLSEENVEQDMSAYNLAIAKGAL